MEVVGITENVCPAASLDRNCIENVCGELVRSVYRNARQFYNEGELREAFFYDWDNLSITCIRRLVPSVVGRPDEYQKRNKRLILYRNRF